MNDKFFDLKKDKQDRIINAALQVFALNGYRHASTDDIVKLASISKGLLFHYFEKQAGTLCFFVRIQQQVYAVRVLKGNQGDGQ